LIYDKAGIDSSIQPGSNHRAAASALSSGRVLKAMAAAGAKPNKAGVTLETDAREKGPTPAS
jgi:hypothetical protein